MAEVRLEVDLAHPPDRVWQALTTARLLGAWFMPTDLEPREGSRFTLDPGTLAGFLGLVSGELLEVVAEHRLVMLWQGEKLHTRVVWELAETAAGCRVQLVQTGFIGAPAALRRRALRDTYIRLFAEQLPAVLDRIATGTGGL
ncbi:MAG: SRPBCC family protein, partial [Natronosporangium sp.]